jgi:RNA polymerase sigma-70 factor, ECF subfamily
MRQTMELLGAGDQEIWSMRHYDQLAFTEAAMVLGVTESAATLRYVRALKGLKKLWQELRGGFEPMTQFASAPQWR